MRPGIRRLQTYIRALLTRTKPAKIKQWMSTCATGRKRNSDSSTEPATNKSATSSNVRNSSPTTSKSQSSASTPLRTEQPTSKGLAQSHRSKCKNAWRMAFSATTSNNKRRRKRQRCSLKKPSEQPRKCALLKRKNYFKTTSNSIMTKRVSIIASRSENA